MTTPQPDELNALGVLIEDICGQGSRLEKLIQQFRHSIEQLGTAHDSSSSQESAAYWRLVAFVDSLVRIRLFLEQNFNYVETVGLLSVARYLFELTVWLRLLRMDSRCGLVYRGELLKKQLEFYTELKNNAVREISFLRRTGAREHDLIETGLAEAMRIPNEEARKNALRSLSDDVTQEIDRVASRSFSLYAEQAQINGYAYQAHIIETKILPEIAKAIAELKQKLDVFEQEVPSDIRSLVPKRWKDRAADQRVKMKDEYDFIYAYASRLLHATPASLTTNQKNLEPDEMRVFLKYIRVRVRDAIEIAEELLRTDSTING